MDKKMLIEALEEISTDTYSWALYFFKIDRRNHNPYTFYKVRFRNDSYLYNYGQALIGMVKNSQLNKIDEIKEYTGENTKVSCDYIRTDNELVKEQWDYFVNDVANASDEKVKGKCQGYVLEGVSVNEEACKSVALVKMANPVINLKNRRSTVFTFDADAQLAEMSDEVCRLYMDTDCIVIDEIIYTFNYKFETLFNIEKTMQKLKKKALEKIISIDAFDDKEKFQKMAVAYKSPRTFVTLSNERVERIKNKKQRKEFAATYGINVNRDGKFIFDDEEKVSLLIRYLCFKLFKDDETKELLEANNVTKLLL